MSQQRFDLIRYIYEIQNVKVVVAESVKKLHFSTFFKIHFADRTNLNKTTLVLEDYFFLFLSYIFFGNFLKGYIKATFTNRQT